MLWTPVGNFYAKRTGCRAGATAGRGLVGEKCTPALGGPAQPSPAYLPLSQLLWQ